MIFRCKKKKVPIWPGYKETAGTPTRRETWEGDGCSHVQRMEERALDTEEQQSLENNRKEEAQS